MLPISGPDRSREKRVDRLATTRCGLHDSDEQTTKRQQPKAMSDVRPHDEK
jgi:hypothetical protein